MLDKRGQVSIFVIIAIVIVGIVIVFFAFRGNLGIGGIPSELQPVFSAYTTCIEDETRGALSAAGLQGGNINNNGEGEEFVLGNNYNPFSSDLIFGGLNVRYWLSFDENGAVKESVPTRNKLEQELGAFIEGQLGNCDLSVFAREGFYYDTSDDLKVSVKVNDGSVDVNVKNNLRVSKGEVSASKSSYDVSVDSAIGKLHSEALKLYDDEKTNVFLENYAVDVLRNYAPVDGVEIQCAPKIWKSQEVVDEVKQALSANIGSLNFDGGNDYFSVKISDDINIDNARVIYDARWPSVLEITPASQSLMIAEPVGNQEGLGVMGFCYVPYHFVYDLRFPVMVQLFEGNDVFQFPLVVIVDNNLARESLSAGGEALNLGDEREDVCSFATQKIKVATYDESLNPLSARISYQCFDQTCEVGETKVAGNSASLEADVPACVNGYLIANAENYTETKQIFSSNSESVGELILSKEYELKVNVVVDGKALTSGSAIVHFTNSDGKSASAVLPENDRVRLSEGLYNVSVFVYGNSSVVLPATTKKECVSVAKGGLFGLFGGTEEKCFDITTPASKIDYALRGGGKTGTYILASELERGEISVYVSGLPLPQNMEQLQTNFALFDSMNAEVSLP